ncbi:MAG: transposase [Gammaproteobacteria bacterium]|nr:transposase [Gammaproteobacteria bacterium]
MARAEPTVHEASEQRYASPRVHESLKQHGNRVGKRRVERVMRENGIGGCTTMRYRRVAGLTRLFTKWGNRTVEAPINGPGQIGVAGLRYLRVTGQWRDLATVMDRCSREPLGGSPGPGKTGGLTRRALRKAIAKRPPVPGPTVHSERGVEFISNAFGHCMERHGRVRSVNRPRRMTDNAPRESGYKSMKGELYHCRPFESDGALRRAVNAYVDFYNEERLHSSLG